MPPTDDDKTVFPHAPGNTGRPGDFVSSSSFFGHTLPEGTRVAEFVIQGLIGEGGFGIVYLAYDPSLQRHVALKEYMPASLAGRANGGLDVVVKSEGHRDTFKAGLKSFVNEARLLARFDHRSLVKVYRFWEDHGTAYMVMPYYEGPTLKRALAERGTPPDEAALRAWLDPLLDALEVLHEAHCYHRDIAPDNILLTPTGPLLLDFGAARRVIGDMTQALTVMLKPGYAPIEQYGEVPAMTQGAWTDLYALASVVYNAITGQAPMSSVERLMADALVPLHVQAEGRYSDRFLRAIDAALELRPKDRPQDVAQWRALLGEPAPAAGLGMAPAPASDPVPAPAPSPAPGLAAASPVVAAPASAPEPGPTVTTTGAWSAVTAPAPIAAEFALPAGGAPDDLAWSPDDTPAPRRPAARHGLRLLGAGVVLAALAATPLLFNAPQDADPVATPPPPPTASTEPAAAVLPPPAVQPVTEPAPAPSGSPAPAIEPPAAAAVTTAPVPAAVAPEAAQAPLPPPPHGATNAPPAPEPRLPAKPAPTAPEPATAAAETPPKQKAAAPRNFADKAAAAPAPERPARRADDAPPRTAEAPPKSEASAAKCSDILQKASLEALSAEETAYLRKECR